MRLAAGWTFDPPPGPDAADRPAPAACGNTVNTFSVERLQFPRPAPTGSLPLYGQLWLPLGSGRVPVMILSHGSSGRNPTKEQRYAAALTAMGVSVLAIDHFAPRGINCGWRDTRSLPD